MEINIIQIFVICVLAGLAGYVNETLNNIPVLKKVIAVLIVVVAVLLLLQSLHVINNTNTSIHVG